MQHADMWQPWWYTDWAAVQPTAGKIQCSAAGMQDRVVRDTGGIRETPLDWALLLAD